MQPPTLERTWTAVVSVDASACAAGSAGKFEIFFLRLKENAPAIEFAERFTWLHPIVQVELKVWADETVERYGFGKIWPCACRG